MIKRRDLLLSGCALLGGAAAASLMGASPAGAHEYELGALIVEHPWVRAPADGEDKAYFYAFIHNNGDSPDRLIGITAEKFGNIEFHPDARIEDKATGIVIPPKQSTTLAPGGAYVLLSGFKKHIEVGWGLEMTLIFEKAGKVVIDAAIEAPDALHAHDGEAQERWKKAHGMDAPQSTAGEHDHDHHDHGDHDHHHHDAAPAPAKQ
jgi:periplasmic copper chaperone A